MKRDEQVLFSNRVYTLFSVCLVALALTAFSCDDDDDDNRTNGPEIGVVENALSDGTWRVTYFFDDTNETSDFAGYTLTFNTDGTASAVSGTETIIGTWDVRSDDNRTKLDLNFGFNSPWDDLEDDWDIVENSDTRIVMEDESGGDGEIDYLTLEKN